MRAKSLKVRLAKTTQKLRTASEAAEARRYISSPSPAAE